MKTRLIWYRNNWVNISDPVAIAIWEAIDTVRNKEYYEEQERFNKIYQPLRDENNRRTSEILNRYTRILDSIDLKTDGEEK